MPSGSDLFLETYQHSRQRFRESVAYFQKFWPDAELDNHYYNDEEDLSTDWIRAKASNTPQKMLVFTIGEHGVEGYVGSAMQQYFLENYLSRLDPKTTGILFVHAINAWGMKHRRRVNAHNVDLNRNFLYDTSELDPAFNPDYQKLTSLYKPDTKQPYKIIESLWFWSKLLGYGVGNGWAGLKTAALLGQYRYPKGIYYGGEKIQEEVALLSDLFRWAFSNSKQVLHLDMHTGYGPRYQMSLVNSPLDGRSSAQCSDLFGYPLVVATTPGEFYALRGDMIDYIYTLRNNEFPDTRLYATSFEFGTYGHKTSAMVRSLRTMIAENRVYWHGALNASTIDSTNRKFTELFYPTEPAWRKKAISDSDQAFQGILKAEGFI